MVLSTEYKTLLRYLHQWYLMLKDVSLMDIILIGVSDELAAAVVCMAARTDGDNLPNGHFMHY